MAARVLRLCRENVVGAGTHRSGWPYVMRGLSSLHSPDGICFEDFIEQRFCYPGAAAEPILEPWVGVFHHPAGSLPFVPPHFELPTLLETPAWRASEPSLRLAVALSSDVARYLSDRLPVRVLALKHPGEVPALRFTPQSFRMNRRKKLLQIGTHLRNTMAIEQVPRLRGMQRVCLSPDLDWAADYERAVRDFWRRRRLRKRYAGADRVRCVPNEEYDELLSRNVVLTEMFACSASNVVIECILRHTPILVNPLPAVLEYLGVDYPLYFKDPREVPDLLAERKVLAAHEYLRAVDKADLRVEHFAEGLRRALESRSPSRRRSEAAR